MTDGWPLSFFVSWPNFSDLETEPFDVMNHEFLLLEFLAHAAEIVVCLCVHGVLCIEMVGNGKSNLRFDS